jgi:hypothetical protein
VRIPGWVGVLMTRVVPLARIRIGRQCTAMPITGDLRHAGVTFRSRTKSRIVGAGSGFVEQAGHMHIGRNQRTTMPVDSYTTYFNVPNGGSVVIDQPDPGVCPALKRWFSPELPPPLAPSPRTCAYPSASPDRVRSRSSSNANSLRFS